MSKTINRAKYPLASGLEVTITKKINLTFPNDDKEEIDLKINLYNIKGYLIPINNGKVLVPEQFDGIYSSKMLSQGRCSKLDSQEILASLYEMPQDLFRIYKGAPTIDVAVDLNRLSNNLKNGILENRWQNLAMTWYNKRLI